MLTASLLRLLRTMFFPAACVISVVSIVSAAEGPQRYLKKSDAWFAGAEAKVLADHILSHQSDLGGWPKNTDTTAGQFNGDRKTLAPTFDNGATTGELRFLARTFRATDEVRFRQAFDKGLAYILDAQYSSGGWPQFAPPPQKTYHRHITFNDNAMARLLEFLRDCTTSDAFGFLPDDRKQAARLAFDRGIQCILKCQIRVNGKLTVWCAQHDENDYRPRPGRTFELASLSGSESVGIVRLLMCIEQPGPEVIESIEAAVAWFETAKLQGWKVVEQGNAQSPTGKDKVVVKAPDAPPLWARFYEIETNRPLFADRDGVPKFDLSEIGYERRNGYAWLGNWPAPMLDREYPAWRKDRGKSVN